MNPVRNTNRTIFLVGDVSNGVNPVRNETWGSDGTNDHRRFLTG